MSTKHIEIFDRLAAPFERGQVKTRPQGGRQLAYVTARTVMNPLDEVLGPENWWDDYTPLEHSVVCRLSVSLPGGEVITKSDAGGCAGMSDAGDDDKSGFSDAFKRAAVKFGVGRYLYQDGVAALTPLQRLDRAIEAATVKPQDAPVAAPAKAPSPKRASVSPVVEDKPDGDVWGDATDASPAATPAPMSAAELYDHVKRTGQLRALRAIQEKCGYPSAVREWSTDQVRVAFARLPQQATSANGSH